MDWYSTHSGFRDLQEQYNTNVGNSSGWTNINNIYYGYADDYYGLNPNGGVVPLTIDLRGIAGAQNDPNFGVRFVAPYDPTLSNVQTLTLNDTSDFTLTFGTQVANVTYSANGAQQAANIQSALGDLSPINNAADPSNVTVVYNGGSIYTVTFGGTLDTTLQPTLVSSGTNDFVSQTQEYASAQVGVGTTPTPGESTGVPNVYAGAKGNWRFDNIEIHGSTIATAPMLVGSPVINGDNPNGLFNAAGQPTPGVQRSMVEDVVYTFSSGVTIPNAAAAFTVVAQGPIRAPRRFLSLRRRWRVRAARSGPSPSPAARRACSAPSPTASTASPSTRPACSRPAMAPPSWPPAAPTSSTVCTATSTARRSSMPLTTCAQEGDWHL